VLPQELPVTATLRPIFERLAKAKLIHSHSQRQRSTRKS
jgi:hypothetical protein